MTTRLVIDHFHKWLRICYSFSLHKLLCFIGISTIEKSQQSRESVEQLTYNANRDLLIKCDVKLLLRRKRGQYQSQVASHFRRMPCNYIL